MVNSFHLVVGSVGEVILIFLTIHDSTLLTRPVKVTNLSVSPKVNSKSLFIMLKQIHNDRPRSHFSFHLTGNTHLLTGDLYIGIEHVRILRSWLRIIVKILWKVLTRFSDYRVYCTSFG